jgi:RNA polymerase sigma factor (TIGR02999 family)
MPYLNKSKPELTIMLRAWSNGDQAALEKLTPMVYQELYKLARGRMAGERPGHVLQASALINEAYIRLIDYQNVQWKDRAHFFGVAAELMRRILVDIARANQCAKRGARAPAVSVDEAVAVSKDSGELIVAVHEVLDRLKAEEPRQARIVELRFFGGLTIEETASVVNLSTATVESEWRLAKAWLKRELSHDKGAGL